MFLYVSLVLCIWVWLFSLYVALYCLRYLSVSVSLALSLVLSLCLFLVVFICRFLLCALSRCSSLFVVLTVVGYCACRRLVLGLGLFVISVSVFACLSCSSFICLFLYRVRRVVAYVARSLDVLSLSCLFSVYWFVCLSLHCLRVLLLVCVSISCSFYTLISSLAQVAFALAFCLARLPHRPRPMRLYLALAFVCARARYLHRCHSLSGLCFCHSVTVSGFLCVSCVCL